jgi:DNA-binding beta-propeller fold protein YncE
VGTFSVGSQPYGVVFDGSYVWVAGPNNITKLQAGNGSVAGSFSGFIGGPYGVAFDGANIWVANFSTNTVSKI